MAVYDSLKARRMKSFSILGLYSGFVLVFLQSKRIPRENAEESYTVILPKL